MVAQWYCDVVITDRDGGIVDAVELDDCSHQASHRQRRDLLLEEVLRQADISLLRSKDEGVLVANVQTFLATVEQRQNV
ncbi:hypothetical protein BB936_22405 (plasmid) [Yersinia enterocolitica]|nr:hypothetical protein BB936_22405 [Yersinia enterocolitica]